MLRVAADACEAARDEETVRRVARGIWAAAGLGSPAWSGPETVAAAFAVQAARGPDLPQTRGPDLPQKLSGAPHEPLEPVEPAPYHAWSVARALAARPAGTEATGGSRAIRWQRANRDLLDRSVVRLGSAWPEMLAELRVCVAQVALLEGPAIDGFTDFATHGAVYVNRTRLGRSPLGLPGPVRFAEALVHEGTHTRCNAAQLGSPFLTAAAGAAAPVRTPLRADPRPLAGLFQQAVVLVRTTELYRRLLDGEPGGSADVPALTARLNRLSGGARQALGTLRQHSGTLTRHGLAVLAECDAQLRPTAA
ncbi:aKG-HExxH-type peptide beta-hydroxylase [Streptomyces sp. NPDC006463]|uniref:aKG-HExxH-type peptide beta-hydroxylase n=1 Tax=Streptomyces sp. NPDC006463 TaxID=3364746 RepID=UPI003696598B